MPALTNGAFSCFGPLSAPCHQPKILRGAAADRHRPHAELAVVPAAQPGRHHAHADPVVHHLVDERPHLVGVGAGVALPHAYPHAQKQFRVCRRSRPCRRWTLRAACRSVCPSSIITVIVGSRRRLTAFCDLALVSNQISPSRRRTTSRPGAAARPAARWPSWRCGCAR